MLHPAYIRLTALAHHYPAAYFALLLLRCQIVSHLQNVETRLIMVLLVLYAYKSHLGITFQERP